MQRDWVEWVVDVAQVLGAVVGVVAIVLAVRANARARAAETRSRDALVRERRIDFHLGLLKELAELNGGGRPVNPSDQAVLASLLPLDLVPLARAAVGVESTAEAMNYVERRRSDPQGRGVDLRTFLRQDVLRETTRAIERLLAERHEHVVESPSLTPFRMPSWVKRLWIRRAASSVGSAAEAPPSDSTA